MRNAFSPRGIRGYHSFAVETLTQLLSGCSGHITIVNYLLNYYPGLEVDKRDPRGLTALMKAAVQGRQDCVAALLLAGEPLPGDVPGFLGKGGIAILGVGGIGGIGDVCRCLQEQTCKRWIP